MSYFLWVEDFAFGEQTREIKKTAEKLLSGIYPVDTFHDDERDLKLSLKKHGTFLELSYQDALGFISTRLNDIDYVILDVDLPAYGENDSINESVLSVLENFEGYISSDDQMEDEGRRKEARNKLKKNAGFYLYAKLVFELGFPKQHILFFSYHGKEAKSIEDAFKTAKIASPEIYLKSDNGIRQCVGSFFDSPYSRLRRGIIEGCRYLTDKSLRFDQNSADKKPITLDLKNYLAILSGFLPLNKPEISITAYKLFVRTLAHEWDEAVKPQKLGNNKAEKQTSFAFSWIMKVTRNWSAHTTVFEQLSEQDVAFLFMVNMRAMFNLGADLVPYERHLLKLFDQSLDQEVFKEKCGNNHESRQIPLTQNYASVLNKYGTNFEAINFHDLLNELQKKQTQNSQFLIKGLYQVFWFLTSFGRVNSTKDDNGQTYLNYQFKYFDYGSQEYLTEIGRHIYLRSFPEA